MDIAAVLFVAGAAGGVVARVAGLQAASATAPADAEAYLRSFDSVDEHDEFGQRLREPFITRVLRPLGQQSATGLAHLLPTNYRDSLHQKLAYAGMSGRV